MKGAGPRRIIIKTNSMTPPNNIFSKFFFSSATKFITKEAAVYDIVSILKIIPINHTGQLNYSSLSCKTGSL
jgi:hypothetical protein